MCVRWWFFCFLALVRVPRMLSEHSRGRSISRESAWLILLPFAKPVLNSAFYFPNTTDII